ncbi:hypothetical protein ACSZN3_22635 [Aeromonas hydrophila]|uniref:hypothetical protein n=1 Tax=Aeromonas hydrophila TaxID=644 RepID=UPI000493A15C|nr:hypothetical protein [Aeromonas hydrophila]HAT1542660.1 hypothetical protein [Aeromonas hydrophila]HAT1555111.1 hypothetical protein [Aeromonas hydrophila]
MIESADLMLSMVLVMGLFFLVAFEIFALIALLVGGLSDDLALLAYACIVILTAPVWGAILFLVMLWISDWLEQRARARRVAQAKARKLKALIEA